VNRLQRLPAGNALIETQFLRETERSGGENGGGAQQNETKRTYK
jgi:hypothetical protein